MLQPWMIPSDLAPGDQKSLEHDWSDVTLHRIESLADPLFEMAFSALWEEFGSVGEIEQASVLAQRMKWDPKTPSDGCALRYRLMLITANGKFVGVRDHTAIVREGCPYAIVHLSHNLVATEWRRTGLAGWLRALPVQTARTCLAAQGRPENSPITLVGEMEYPHEDKPASLARLRAYEKAGYKKIDPRRINYLQPDFRKPEEIDSSGGPSPIPLTLIIRRVGKESEDRISSEEVRDIVESLYRMYRAGFRASDVEPLFAHLNEFPPPGEWIDLVAPTLALSV